MIEAKLKCKKKQKRKRSYHGLIIITNYEKNGGDESNFISCHPLLRKYIWKVREMMQIANIAFLGQTSYYKIQKQILFSVVNQVCKNNRAGILLALKGNMVELVGDGRSDSPGYNAKYGNLYSNEQRDKKHFRLFCCIC